MNMYNPYELYHHGIIGQKWGVRRFQNKDGTLTPAGRKRKAKLESELNRLDPEKKSKTDVVAATSKMKIEDMTDEEVKTRTDRLNLEKNLMDAEYNRKQSYSKLNPVQTKKGEDFIKKAGSALWKDIAAPILKSNAEKLGKRVLKEKFGIDMDQKSEHDRLKEENDIWAYKVNIAKNKRAMGVN